MNRHMALTTEGEKIIQRMAATLTYWRNVMRVELFI